MARRRKKTARHHRRRRHSMSGTGASTMTSILAMTAGALAARVISNKFSSKVNPKLLAAGEVALGLMLPKFVKNKFAAGVGSGMVVGGALNGLQSFGVISAISGIGEDISVSYGAVENPISGAYEMDDMGLVDNGIMSGADNLSIIAGEMDEYDY